VFSHQFAQRVLNYQMDKVSTRQIKANTGVSFYDLLVEDVDPDKMAEYEQQLNRWIEGVLNREHVPDKNRPSARAHLKKQRRVANETMARFAMGIEYAKETGDTDPDVAINMAVGNGSHLVKHHPKAVEWLSDELRNFVARTSSTSAKEESMPTQSEEKEKGPASTVERWLPGIKWTETEEDKWVSEFQSELSDSVAKVTERRSKEVGAGIYASWTSAQDDVWIPALDAIPYIFAGARGPAPRSCYDISVRVGSAPGNRLVHTTGGAQVYPNAVDVDVDHDMAYRELQIVKVLGAGTFGVVCKILDSTLKDTIDGSHADPSLRASLRDLARFDDAFLPVQEIALKISTEEQRLLTDDGTQNPDLFMGGAIGEFIIGQFVNAMFLRVRERGSAAAPMAVTPNVIESLFGFICRRLPPPRGKWNTLYRKMDALLHKRGKPGWRRDTRSVSNIRSDRLVVVCNAMELATEGSLKSAQAALGGLLSEPDYVQSLLFQGLFALAAFEEYGFLHQDIKPDNLGITDLPEHIHQIYHIDVSGEGSSDPRYVTYEPTQSMMHARDRPRAVLKFLDYGNYNLTDQTVHEMVGSEVHVRKAYVDRYVRGTVTYTAPEGFMMPKFLGRPAGNWTQRNSNVFVARPVFSSASDVWSFGLSLVAIIKGENPLNATHREPWSSGKSQLWQRMKAVVTLPGTGRDSPMADLARYWTAFGSAFQEGPHPRPTWSAFTILFSFIEMVGYPWTNHANPGTRDKDLIDFYVKSGHYPIAEVLYGHVKAYPSTFRYAPRGGWLRYDPDILEALGASDRSVRDRTGLHILLRMLSWRPEDRSDPHLLLRSGIGIAPVRGFWKQMYISESDVAALDKNREARVERYGWELKSLNRDTVRMVGGHMSMDHARHLERLQFVEAPPPAAAPAKMRLPTWKMSRLPIDLAKTVDAHPLLSRLFGTVHSDDREAVFREPVEAVVGREPAEVVCREAVEVVCREAVVHKEPDPNKPSDVSRWL